MKSKIILYFWFLFASYNYASIVQEIIDSKTEEGTYKLLKKFNFIKEIELLDDKEILNNFIDKITNLKDLYSNIPNSLGFLGYLITKNLQDEPVNLAIFIKKLINSVKENNAKITSPFLINSLYSLYFVDNLYFTDIPGFIPEELPKKSTEPIKKDNISVYANQEGYLDNIDIQYIKGNKLVFAKEKYPIGYNIYINRDIDMPKKYIIIVYGGGQRNDQEIKPYSPKITAFIKGLLEKGFGVIQLNLPDLLLSEKHQRKQAEEIHNLVQEGIHHFVEVFKSNPGSLDDFFNDLKDPQLFLFGSSFGGRTSFKYAASVHHKDFLGYISHAGDLLKNIQNQDKIKHIFLQKEDLESLKNSNTSLLLLHNLDDNRVPSIVSINFYKQARKLGIEKIELLITKLGDPALLNELDKKGHSLPRLEKEFKKSIDTISNFIDNGPKNYQISDKRLSKYEVYANISTKDPSMSLFLAQALRIYLYAKAFSDYLENATQILDPNKQDKIWEKYYEPIYLIIMYIEKYKYFNLNDYLTEKNIDDIIMTSFLPKFFEFVKEVYDIDQQYFNKNTLIYIMKKKIKDTHEAYMDDPENIEDDIPSLIYKNLCYLSLMAHPDLINKLISPDEKEELLKNKDDAKEKLIKMLLSLKKA